MSIKTSACALFCAAAFFAAPAHANQDSVDFRFKRYELQTAGGTEALYRRLKRQAYKECGGFERRSLQNWLHTKECTALMIQEIVVLIDDERLTALHDAKTASK